MCDNTWLKDVLLIMISLEEILSAKKEKVKPNYHIPMGRGLCNICLIYFQIVSESIYSVP